MGSGPKDNGPVMLRLGLVPMMMMELSDRGRQRSPGKGSCQVEVGSGPWDDETVR